jgi:hypothetical protein
MCFCVIENFHYFPFSSSSTFVVYFHFFCAYYVCISCCIRTKQTKKNSLKLFQTLCLSFF